MPIFFVIAAAAIVGLLTAIAIRLSQIRTVLVDHTNQLILQNTQAEAHFAKINEAYTAGFMAAHNGERRQKGAA